MKPISMVIAHSCEIFIAGLKKSLSEKYYSVDHVFTDGKRALDFILTHEPSLVILSESFPRISAREILKAASLKKLRTKFVVVYVDDGGGNIIRSRWWGAMGSIYIGDSVSIWHECIEQICNGNKYHSISFFKGQQDYSIGKMEQLTPAELRVLKAMYYYPCCACLAENLKLSKRTVEKHRGHIIAKLNLRKKSNSLMQWVLNHKELIDSFESVD